MRFEIRDRDKRALTFLALGAGLYLLLVYVVMPAYDGLQSDSETVVQKEEELRRYRRALNSRTRYAQLLDQATKSVAEAEGRLIRGDNSSLASVELQTIVEEASKKVEVSLAQRSMTPAKKRDDFFNEITMSVSFESTPNQLTSFLSELRASPKFVTVRSLQVSPVTAAQEAPTKGQLKKTVKANVTVAALLAPPPAGGTQ